MRVFLVKAFGRFRRKEKLSDELLLRTIDVIQLGLVDADLGRGLIKQRVAREGQAKSGGYRTLIAVRSGKRAVYLLGFGKNDTPSLKADELADLRVLTMLWLGLSDDQIERAVATGDLQEVPSE